MNREETPSIVPPTGSTTTPSLGGETINPITTPSIVPPSGSTTTPSLEGKPITPTPTTSTETFDHLADHNLIGGLTMP